MISRFLFISAFFVATAANAQQDSVTANDSVGRDSLSGQTVFAVSNSTGQFTAAFNYCCYSDLAIPWNYPFLQYFIFPLPPGPDTIPLPGKTDIASCVHQPTIAFYIPSKPRRSLSSTKQQPEDYHKTIASVAIVLLLFTIFLARRVRRKGFPTL